MKNVSLILAILAISFSASSQNIYIQYDSKCMDKFEYRFVQSESENVAYTAYRLHKNATEKLYFETGVENVVVKKSLPAKLTPCNKITFDKDDVAAINKGVKKVYICKKLDSGWAILPVGTTTYMYYENQFLTVQGPDYDFMVDFNQPVSSNNLSGNPDPAMSTIFYGGQYDACNQQSAWLFTKSPNETCKDEAQLSFLPSVGLIQDKSSSGQNFELVGINGVPVCDYLLQGSAPKTITQSEPQPENISTVSSESITATPAASDIPQEYNKPIVREKNVIIAANEFNSDKDENTTQAVPETVVEQEKVKIVCNLEAKEGEHLVTEGESLYGIARRYGLTVSSLRSWNELANDIIYPCSILKVIAPAPAEQPGMTITRTSDVPMSYEETPAKVNEKPVAQKVDCNVEAAEGEHIVQQGETLYAISRMYGVKVDEISTWNNLSSNSIKPCTKLVVVAPVVQSKSVDVPKQYSTVVKPKSQTKTVSAAKSPKAVKTVAKTTSTPKPKSTVVNAKKVVTKPVKAEEVTLVRKESCMYVAKEGETVAELAKRFGVSESEFRRFNNIGAKDKIFAGQVLKKQNSPCFVEDELPENYCVEAKPKSAVTKKDVKIETTSVTSKKAEEVPHSYNTVILPKPIKVKEDVPVVTSKSPENRTRKYHVVKADETLTTIAKMYGTTVEKLRSINKLESNELIIPNQVLNLE